MCTLLNTQGGKLALFTTLLGLLSCLGVVKALDQTEKKAHSSTTNYSPPNPGPDHLTELDYRAMNFQDTGVGAANSAGNDTGTTTTNFTVKGSEITVNSFYIAETGRNVPGCTAAQTNPNYPASGFCKEFGPITEGNPQSLVLNYSCSHYSGF